MYLTCKDGEGLPYTDIEKTSIKRSIKRGLGMYEKEVKRQKKERKANQHRNRLRTEEAAPPITNRNRTQSESEPIAETPYFYKS